MPARRRDPGSAGLLDLPRIVAIRRDAERRRRLLSAPDLTYLFWESTLRCNLRCTHCGSSCEARSPVRELETAQVKAILDTIARDFDARRIFVSITGGEPLLRPDLFDVVAHMSRLGMRSCIVTNGTLLDADAARRLHDAGMRTVTVSVDGLEREHDEVRGRGTWRKAIAALGVARRAAFRTVEAVTCVRPANVGSLAEIEKTVREAGAGRWRVITVDRMGRGGSQGLWLGPAEVRQLLEFVRRRRDELRRAGDRFDVRFSCGGFLGVDSELRVRPRNGQCFAGLCVASILCDGAVGACPSLPRDWAQGSALERRFSDIWRTEFRRHRDPSWRRPGPCEGCQWFASCLGGGLHERLAQPDEFCWLDRQRE